MRARICSVTLAVGAVLALGACGGGSGGVSTSGPSTAPTTSTNGASTATTAPADENTFSAPDVAFTFQYPADFTQEDADLDKVLARIAPDPNDPTTAIKIRLTSDQELATASYLGKLRAQFEQQVGAVAESSETHSGLEMGVLSFSNAFTPKGATETTTLSSTSYFFPGGGKTWQFECLSTPENKPAIDAACAQAIDSIKFS